jgi:hypothetical protein
MDGTGGLMDRRRKFTEEKAREYVKELARTGLIMRSATAVGVGWRAVRALRKRSPEFEEAVQDALELYREAIAAEIHRRALEGVETPVFGSLGPGLGSGEVGHVRKYSDKLLELHAKRHIQAYREKAIIDANFSGGVLLVREPPKDEEEWRKRHEDEPE